MADEVMTITTADIEKVMDSMKTGPRFISLEAWMSSGVWPLMLPVSPHPVPTKPAPPRPSSSTSSVNEDGPSDGGSTG